MATYNFQSPNLQSSIQDVVMQHNSCNLQSPNLQSSIQDPVMETYSSEAC